MGVRVKVGLIVGCINYYPAPEGWRHIHVDATDRMIYDESRHGFVKTDVRADVRALPVANASVDRVQLWDVLEHLDGYGAMDALRELRRVLRPDGELDIQVPNIGAAARAYAAGELNLKGLLQLVYGERLADHREEDLHRHGWTASTLALALVRSGFDPGPDLASGSMIVRYKARRLHA